MQLGHGDDVGSAGLVLDKGALAEVVSGLVLVDLDGGLADLDSLGGDGLTLHDQVEGVAVLVTLLDDQLLGLVPLLLEGVSELAALVLVHVLEDLHALEELVVLLALLGSSILHDVVEGVAVQLPELSISLGCDGGSTGSVVEECKLTEGLAWVVLLQEGRSCLPFLYHQ